MNLELPADLQPTVAILRGSLMRRTDEKVPAIPTGLFEDLATSFEKNTAGNTQFVKVSLFTKIRSFLSAPAFGMSAAALAILAVVLPITLKTSENSEISRFRGGAADSGVTASSSIVLIGASQEIVSFLGNSGDFEKSSIFTTESVAGAKVIVDFKLATITAITADGQSVHRAALPSEKADFSAAIAEALSKL